MKIRANILQTLLLTIVATSCALLPSAPAQAAKIADNNFEDDSYGGWVPSTPDNSDIANSNGENKVLYLRDPGTLSQTLVTLAGVTYQLSYDLEEKDAGGKEFKVTINDIRPSLFGVPVPFSEENSTFAGNKYTYNFIGSGSDTIEFDYGELILNDPSQFRIDNIAVNSLDSTSVPEPFTILGTLIGGIAALRMRIKANKKSKHKTHV
jgi:hypothetical protein